ncbi:twin-arginine translocation signal domain-containing protein, partial [Paenibacillus polymyxa]|nr:twin-arginine translocation signal domain-containing protein [Paenibacillus polymyxa]
MTVSRRGFMAALAVTAAALPTAAYFGYRELQRRELDVREPETPGE